MKARHGTLGVLLGLLLGVGVLLCEASITDRYVTSVYLATGLLLLLCAVPPILSRARLLEPINAVGAFYFLAYGVGGVFLLQFSEYQYAGTYSYLLAASAVAALGYASLICGYFLARGGLGRWLPRPPEVSSPLKIKATIVVLYGFGWAARLLLIFKYHVFFNDVLGTANKVSYIGFILFVESFCLISVVLAIVAHAASRRDWLLGAMLLVMLPTEFFVALLRGIKGGPLMLLGTLFLVRHAFGRMRLVTGFAGGVLACILVFLFMNFYRAQGFGFGDPRKTELSGTAVRTAALQAAINIAAAKPSLAVAYGSQMIAARLSHINELAVIVKRLGSGMEFQMGSSYVPFAASVVPRFLWRERPMNMFDNGFAQSFGFIGRENFITVINIPTAPIEMYINFGVPGVVIGMFFFGVFMRVGYDLLIGSGRMGVSGMLVYVFFLATCVASLEMPFSVVYMGFSRALIALVVVALLIRAGDSGFSNKSAPVSGPGRGVAVA